MKINFLFLMLALFSPSLVLANEVVAVAENEPEPVRHVNLRIKPMGLVTGVFGAELQTALPRSLSSRLTLGFSFDYYENQLRNRVLNAYEFGIIVDYSLENDRFKDGWILQPALRKLILTHGSNTNRNHAGLYLSVDAGYQWHWKSGWNQLLGAGLITGLDSSRQRTLDPILLWQVGLAI